MANSTRFTAAYGRLTHPLLWLITAVVALGVLRALLVPPGDYNQDESIHLAIIRLYETSLHDSAWDFSPLLIYQGGADPYRGFIYYLLQASVQTLLPPATADWDRLVAARLVTLALGLAAILLAYLTVRELFPRKRLWALAAAGLAALIPSLGDLIAGVNLDAPAALAGALILCTLARILRRGLTVGRVVALAIVSGLGYVLKGTVWPLYAVIAFCFWSFLPWRIRVPALGLAALGGMITIVSLKPINWDGAAHWYYQRGIGTPARLLPDRTVISSVAGDYSLEVTDHLGLVVQYFSDRVTGQLRGKTFTYGVWIRAADADADTVIPPPACAASGEAVSGQLPVSSRWQFYAARARVPSDAAYWGCFLGLPPPGYTVLYDGVIAVEGVFPTDVAPHYADPDARTGVWGGVPFVNLLQNASAEQAWPQAGDAIGLPYLLNQRIVAVLDWQRTWTTWFALSRWLIVSFWSGFGGILPGLNRVQLIPFAALTAIAMAGVGVIAVRDVPRRISPFDSKVSRRGFWILIATFVAVLALLLYRADILANQPLAFSYSATRHASASAAAVSALLALGALRWVPRRWQRPAVAVGLLALFWVNIYILLFVQYPFQHCPVPSSMECLSTVH